MGVCKWADIAVGASEKARDVLRIEIEIGMIEIEVSPSDGKGILSYEGVENAIHP